MGNYPIATQNVMYLMQGEELKAMLQATVKEQIDGMIQSGALQPQVEAPTAAEAHDDGFISRKRLMTQFDLSDATLWRYEQRGILQSYQFGDDDDSRLCYYKLSEVYDALKKKSKRTKRIPSAAVTTASVESKAMEGAV